MGIGDSVGKFAIGAVQGLDYGVGRGMDLSQKYHELQDANEVRSAKEALNKQFQEAAEAGGLDKMPNDWFASAGANIMRTGDLQNATAFMQMGTAIRTQKAQSAGQRASISLASGNPTAAVGDLNTAFDAMGIPSKIVGLTPDGGGYQMDDGSVMPAQRALDVTTKLMLTPKEALAYAIDQQQANATSAVAASNVEKNAAITNSTNALLGPKMGALAAQAQASRSTAYANTELGQQREAMTPYMQAEAAADATAKQVAAQKAINMAPLEEEAQRLKNVGERQDQAQSMELHGPELARKIAEATKTEQDAAIPPVSTDPRWQGGHAAVKAAADNWDANNFDAYGEPKPEAIQNMADPFSPILRTTTAAAAARVREENPALSGDASVEHGAATINGLVQIIASHPANIELDQAKTAQAVNQIMSYQNIDPGALPVDDKGRYLLMNIDGADTKVYLGPPPTQQAIPAP